MTAIASGQGLMALLSQDTAVRDSTGDEALDPLAGVEQAGCFMALLQQAAAVLPQAVATIREHLPAEVTATGEGIAASSAVDPDAVLSALAGALSVRGADGSTSNQLTPADVTVGLAPSAVSPAGTSSEVPLQIATSAVLESLSGAEDAGVVVVTPSLAAGASSDTASESAPAQRAMQTPVGAQGWADELGARLSILNARGEQTASLRLSPEHLGPLEIRIAIKDDQASVWFGAAHAQTREAIEQAMPRLREMLQTQGLTLSDAGVFDDSPGRQSAFTARSGTATQVGPQEVAEPVTHSGLLDLYV